MTERGERRPSQEIEHGSLWRMTKATFDVASGSQITRTISEAIELSRRFGWHDFDEKGAEISFEFNGVNVTVKEDSDPKLIHRDWSRGLSGYITEVGPYPKPELSEEDKANDARIEAENELRRQERHAEYVAKEEAKRQRVEARLVGAAPMEFSDEDAWKQSKMKNKDGYGGAVISYAERWARLMQVEMAEGRLLEDVADSTSHDADLEGITGFQYGVAVSTLSRVWSHGEELRKWHNLQTQIGDEGKRANESGGVLNPALLSLGPQTN